MANSDPVIIPYIEVNIRFIALYGIITWSLSDYLRARYNSNCGVGRSKFDPQLRYKCNNDQIVILVLRTCCIEELISIRNISKPTMDDVN